MFACIAGGREETRLLYARLEIFQKTRNFICLCGSARKLGREGGSPGSVLDSHLVPSLASES